MKKPILTAALALAISAGAVTPAHAADSHKKWVELQSFAANPIKVLIGLLLPAVQSARDTGR